jgi:hypothetical protein
MEALGRLVNVIPAAAGVGISLIDADSILFVMHTADTYTLTAAPSFAGSYTSPGNIITKKYTNTSVNGTAPWVEASQAAANTVVIAGATAVAIHVSAASLPDGQKYVKMSAAATGLVKAIVYDLHVARKPSNLPALSA